MHRKTTASGNNSISIRDLLGILCILLYVGSTLSARPQHNRYQKWRTHRGDTNYVKSRSKVSPGGQRGYGVNNDGLVPKERGNNGIRDLLQFYRGVPRSQWSCCMLGRLAGEKGFSCHAQFYRSSIYLRNRNRAHNKKLNFHGPNSNPRFGKKLMYTFRKCVGKRSHVFHKCCYGAVMEWRIQRLWQTDNRLPVGKHTDNTSYKRKHNSMSNV